MKTMKFSTLIQVDDNALHSLSGWLLREFGPTSAIEHEMVINIAIDPPIGLSLYGSYGWIKVMLCGSFNQGYNALDLEQLISFCNVEHFSLDKVHEVFSQNSLAVELIPLQVLATIWFTEESQLNSFFYSGSHWGRRRRKCSCAVRHGVSIRWRLFQPCPLKFTEISNG